MRNFFWVGAFCALVLCLSCAEEALLPASESAIVTETFKVSDWIKEPAVRWHAQVSFPAITQEVMDSGAVLVYLKVNDAYNQIPLTFFPGPDVVTSIQVSTHVAGFVLFWSTSDYYNDFPKPDTADVKVTVIPPGLLGSTYIPHLDTLRALEHTDPIPVTN